MKIGDLIESAIWLTGDESQEIRHQYEADVRYAISALCEDQGYEHGPVTFREKHPGTDGIPPVPDHIQGSRVRLLVAEAEVVGIRVLSSKGSFVANLEKKDLQRLRTITRRTWAKNNPNDLLLSNKQCDDYIEQLGPETAVELIRAQYHTLQ